MLLILLRIRGFKTINRHKINPVIYILICSILGFAFLNSLFIFALNFFGDTTLGVLTSYSTRIEDWRAGQNLTRTVFKGYSFDVDNKEYKGYVVYSGDEAWPQLKEGEVRREIISYFPVFPYINKPENLVDFYDLGLGGIISHIIRIVGCAFLFFLVNGNLHKRKKPRKEKKTNKAIAEVTYKEERRNDSVFCHNCGSELKEGAAFCSGCGTPVQKTRRGFCVSCGAGLGDGASFCGGCGAPVQGAATSHDIATAGQDPSSGPGLNQRVPYPDASTAREMPLSDAVPVQQRPLHGSDSGQGGISQNNSVGLIGWSLRCDEPEILEAARKRKRFTINCLWLFAILFPLGFLILNFFVKELPLFDAIVIGTGVGLVITLINLWFLKDMKRPPWQGVVVDKSKKERRQNKNDESMATYTEYTTVVRTDAGKKKRIIEKDSRNFMYSYLKVGDRVKFHPAFSAYEKYDKSKDRIIYCAVCSTMNPIKNERCKRCNNYLFK